MKKILFTLLIAMGVVMSASAQVDMNAVVKKTAEQVCKEKNLAPEKKGVIEEILMERVKDSREINAKKLPAEQRQAEIKRVTDKAIKMINEKVAPNTGSFVINKFNKNRTEAAEAAKKK